MNDLICGCSQGGDCTRMSVCQAESLIEEMQERIAELEKLNKNLERQFVEDTAKIQELENLLTGRGPSQVS